MPRSKPPPSNVVPFKVITQAEHDKEMKAERNRWRRDAKRNVVQRAAQLDSLQRNAPAADDCEADEYYEAKERARERLLGIPEDADPIQVMLYIEERWQALQAKYKRRARQRKKMG